MLFRSVVPPYVRAHLHGTHRRSRSTKHEAPNATHEVRGRSTKHLARSDFSILDTRCSIGIGPSARRVPPVFCPVDGRLRPKSIIPSRFARAPTSECESDRYTYIATSCIVLDELLLVSWKPGTHVPVLSCSFEVRESNGPCLSESCRVVRLVR